MQCFMCAHESTYAGILEHTNILLVFSSVNSNFMCFNFLNTFEELESGKLMQ